MKVTVAEVLVTALITGVFGLAIPEQFVGASAIAQEASAKTIVLMFLNTSVPSGVLTR